MNYPLLCNILYALEIGFFASLSGGSQADHPFEVEENIVYFRPEIKLESGSVCQGLRVAQSLASTSADCIRKLHEFDPEKDIGLVDISQNQVATINRGDHLQYANVEADLLLQITPSDHRETVYDIALYHGSTVPDRNTAYYLSGSRLIEHPVSFRQPDAQTTTGFLDLEASSNLPPGAPVFNERYELVCVMAENDQCRVLSPGLVHRTRSLQQQDEYEEVNISTIIESIYGVIPALVVTTLTVSFYIILAIHAHRKGMPMSVFWPGILLCSYCKGCNGMSCTFCGIGSLVGAITGGVCAIPLWWAAAFSAGWNWVNKSVPFQFNLIVEPLENSGQPEVVVDQL